MIRLISSELRIKRVKTHEDPLSWGSKSYFGFLIRCNGCTIVQPSWCQVSMSGARNILTGPREKNKNKQNATISFPGEEPDLDGVLYASICCKGISTINSPARKAVNCCGALSAVRGFCETPLQGLRMFGCRNSGKAGLRSLLGSK